MKLQDKANKYIAQGALTNSKRPSTFVEGIYPTHVFRGEGCMLYDYDNNRYFDFICGLGSNILGYGHPEVNREISRRLKLGLTLSLPCHEELNLAECLNVMFPYIESMRFLKTGSEAASAAIRIARTYTKRNWVLSEGYHGWHDAFVSMTPPALGIEEKFKFMDLKQAAGRVMSPKDIAAIIVEPVIIDNSEKRKKELQNIRQMCTENGIVLIFDEIITGFRYEKFSVANAWEIYPDISLFGKAIANGMPLSVVGGKSHIMNCDEYFVSSTFAGETASIAAALKTIELLKSVYRLDGLWQKGRDWIDFFNEQLPDKIRIEGYPTRGRFVGDEFTKALFFQEACLAGLLFGPSWFYNFPLSDNEIATKSAIKDILCRIKSKNVALMGKMPKSPFAEQLRKNK